MPRRRRRWRRRAANPDPNPNPYLNLTSPSPNPGPNGCRPRPQVEAEGGEADAATRARLWPMWRRQARQPLERRLSAADMLRQEGNAKFSQADFAGALKE